MSTYNNLQSSQTVEPDRNIRFAWICFGGTFVALVLNGIWTMVVGTASPGADEKDHSRRHSDLDVVRS
jgi:hypothetical protein